MGTTGYEIKKRCRQVKYFRELITQDTEENENENKPQKTRNDERYEND